jgi:hypothetical protein
VKKTRQSKIVSMVAGLSLPKLRPAFAKEAAAKMRRPLISKRK